MNPCWLEPMYAVGGRLCSSRPSPSFTGGLTNPCLAPQLLPQPCRSASHRCPSCTYKSDSPNTKLISQTKNTLEITSMMRHITAVALLELTSKLTQPWILMEPICVASRRACCTHTLRSAYFSSSTSRHCLQAPALHHCNSHTSPLPHQLLPKLGRPRPPHRDIGLRPVIPPWLHRGHDGRGHGERSVGGEAQK